MKKYVIYIGILVIGVFLGWIIFRTNSHESHGSVSKDETISETWTCSMHPQIRRAEPGKCPICGMNLIPLELNGSENPLIFEMTEDAVRISNIETTVIGERNLTSNKLKLSGKIQVNETNASSIVAHIPGRIEKLYVSFTGENIKKGQKIARIYSPKLITAQKELLEAYKFKAVNPSLFNAAVNKLRYWKLSQKQINAIIINKKTQELFSVYADYSGAVLNKRVNVGDYISEGQSLFDIQNLSQLWAVFDVYESDISNLRLGDKVTFSTNSQTDKKFTTNITFIDPVINPNTRTTSARGVIGNIGGDLKPEMFIQGVLNGGIQKQNLKLTVPKTAVMWTGERSVVYVKLPDVSIPSFEFREIVIGASYGTSYQIVSGLVAGEEVVTKGAFVIDASAQLNNQASMMNRNLVKTKTSISGKKNYINVTPQKFALQLESLIRSYVLLKNELVVSDAKKASAEANRTLKSADNINMKLLKGEAHEYWMKQLKLIKRELSLIAESKKLKSQRSAFDRLSRSMITSANAFGVSKKRFYVQYCPMSIGGKGSYWISEESKILNPYFGDAMLNCGSITDTIEVLKKSELPKVKKLHRH